MRKYLLAIGRMALLSLAFALLFTGWAKPAWAFHKERKTVEKIVSIHKEIEHHLDEGKLDWHHLGEEFTEIAKPVRDLGHHDKVNLFKLLEDAVRNQDPSALEKTFQKISFYLVRENLHRSEDSVGKLEKTVIGFIDNARMAYGSLAGKSQSVDKSVDQIFQEMKMIAREAQTLKAKLAEKKKELETQLSGMIGN
ncbi:MAG TPA: hypothetical protein ENI07_07640 [Desulfobacterales bacterium]|nr:hypothetical protein [Desulfobacterales bacterium]